MAQCVATPNQRPVPCPYIGVVGLSPESSRADAAERDEFARWVEPHWSAMTGLAWRLVEPGEVEDVVQEALTAAWRLRGRFDEARGSARGWLLALTADHARRVRRRRARSARMVSLTDVPAAQALDGRADHDLAEAIGKLSGRQRLAVELYYYLDLPVSEVAVAMRCSDGTVKSTLADARRQLRRLLGDDHA